MFEFNRRRFLGTALGGMAAGLGGSSLSHSLLWGADDKVAESAQPRIPAPDTLFLTWQRDPTTTMTIQWIAPAAMEPVSIQYAKHESKPQSAVWQTASLLLKPFPDTELKVHRCELHGLTPGTEYQFSIGEQGAIQRFRTMPAKATDSLQFVTGGDAGTGSHAVQSNIMAAKQEPWFAFIGGDLAYDNGKSPETFVKFLQNYSAHMLDPHGRRIPMLACLGNHEVNGGYKQKRDKGAHFLSVFDGFYSETTYGVFDIGDYLSLVLLDTDHISPIAGEQTSWLEQTLRERADRPHLIVASHVPAYPSYRAPQVGDDKPGTGHEQRQHWCPLFERYKVDVALEHHDHTFKRTHPLTNGMHDKHGVIYLGDGSWGKLRAPVKPEKRPYLAAVSESYHVTLHRLEGEQRFHIALTDAGRVADVCLTTSKRPSR